MPSGRKHYQLSNFYKHLTQAGQCTTIERKRKGTESEDDDDSATPLAPHPLQLCQIDLMSTEGSKLANSQRHRDRDRPQGVSGIVDCSNQ
jgi:hypothetical protein